MHWFIVVTTHSWRIIMNSLIVRKTSGRRLVLISAATLLYANSVLAAQPEFDAQAQARQFILAKPSFGVATDSKTRPIAAVAAQANLRVDAQAQARQFILSKSNFGVATDSKINGIAAVAAQNNRRVDAQEQARQFILAKPNVDRLASRVIAPPTARRGNNTQPMDRGSGNPG
jgi:hypothetical protein